MSKEGHLYFHSPCFDGIASAVLTLDFLKNSQGWSSISLHSVNYHLREKWLSLSLEMPCAIVDFLYHPQADFWADHHLTTFLSENIKKEFELRSKKYFIYDKDANSCAGLLMRHLKHEFNYWNPRYVELARWAEKTDSASYESPEEAIFAPAPALKISLSLVLGNRDKYCERLVFSFAEKTIDQVADSDDVKKRIEIAMAQVEKGLERFKDVARIENDNIVIFDADSKDAIISRYAPFYFFPKARYAAGIIRFEKWAKIVVMRNPWLEFESVPLGKICEKFGGGGHQRIGAINIADGRVAEAPSILNQLLFEIRNEQKTQL
jgi:hypothetical protein